MGRFYTDPAVNTPVMGRVQAAASLGTSTASATTGADVTPGIALPQFIRRTELTGVKFYTTTIPHASHSNLRAVILNGTNTAAVVVLTTATASQWLKGTVTASNAIFAADSAPTIKVIGTATASGSALGAYDMWLET
jgi:hypothetical protein